MRPHAPLRTLFSILTPVTCDICFTCKKKSKSKIVIFVDHTHSPKITFIFMDVGLQVSIKDITKRISKSYLLIFVQVMEIYKCSERSPSKFYYSVYTELFVKYTYLRYMHNTSTLPAFIIYTETS